MSETPWTPGPSAVKTRRGPSLVPGVEDPAPFHNVVGPDGETLGVYPFAEADARLIAKAPEMARLLERVREEPGIIFHGRYAEYVLDAIDALLAEIRGATTEEPPE